MELKSPVRFADLLEKEGKAASRIITEQSGEKRTGGISYGEVGLLLTTYTSPKHILHKSSTLKVSKSKIFIKKRHAL